MKNILILACMVVLAFGFVSCGKDGSGSSGVYTVQINFYVPDPTKPTTVPVGQGATFSVTATQNGKQIDSSDVTVSTFKDSTIETLRIWNDGGSIDIQSNETITKKYGEITGCKIGAVSGTGSFGLNVTYKGVTDTVTFGTN